MGRLLDELNRLKKKYESARNKAISYIAMSPQGYLRVSKERNRTQYYQVFNDSKRYNGVYIRKNEIARAKALAQKDYCEDLVAITTKRLEQIESFLSGFSEYELEDTYTLLSVERKELITPIILDDEEYIKRWMAAEYQRKPRVNYYSNGKGQVETEYYSKRGEKVRSKSEKIIADMLTDMGVAYRYEYPIPLKGYHDGVAYVDFYLLNARERKEICYEHYGMADKPEYYNDMVFRTNCYLRNGYVLGDNLLFSFESTDYPLNLNVVEKQVRSILGM